MSSSRLYIFNPDTDMALGSGCRNYTPPLPIQAFVARLCLLPALYAEPDSMLLLPRSMTRLRASDRAYYPIVRRKNIRLVKEEDLVNTSAEVCPWGWDETLMHRLQRIQGFEAEGVDMSSVCSARRRLSHRRLTIDIHRRLNALLSKSDIAMPEEFDSLDSLIRWAEAHPGCYLKSPWSSSGKGIFHLTDANRHLLPSWAKGVIAKQGSVMAEIGEERSLDFATEWVSEHGVVKFKGYSVFEVNDHGGYLGNILQSESELEQTVRRHAPSFTADHIAALQQVLTETIAADYEGPLGVDMLSTTDGRLNLCVEVNLRRTMGHVALDICRQGTTDTIFRPGEPVAFSV